MAGADPYRNHNFKVEIDGITQLGFCEVRPPTASVDVIEYREGGDSSVIRKLSGLRKYSNVTLKWGVTNSRELFDWWKSVQDGKVQRRNLSIILLNEEHLEVKRWNVFNAWPVSYKAPDLNAEGTDVAIEELVLACEGLDLA
jgi:phage tail-like protein